MNTISNYRHRIDAVIVSKISKEKMYWKLVAQRKTNHAYEYAFRVPVGYSIQDIEKNLSLFIASCGAPIELENRGGIVIFKVFTTNFPKTIPFRQDMLMPDKILLGFDRSMKPIYHSFQTNPHILVGGMSGYGKTDLLRLIIYQLSQNPDTEIIIVDMKGFSFLPFTQIKIARNLESAYRALNYAVDEMLHREQLVWENRSRDIIKEFHPIVVVIDEAAQIAPKLQSNKYTKALAASCDECCAKIATKGREPKVSLIYTTQRPDHEVINGQVKANMDCAIAMRTKTAVNSMIILDHPGAEELPHKVPGRAIYSSTSDIILQIPYVGDDNAWHKLLSKTEVTSHGKSERRKKEPRVIDVSHDSVSDNGTNRKALVSGERIAGETVIGDAQGDGVRADRRRQAHGQHEKGVAALPQGQAFTKRYNDTDTVEYDET